MRRPVARRRYGLVVARIDGKAQESVHLRCFLGGQEGREDAVFCDERGVRDGHAAAGAVVYGQRGQVLDERASAPDVERLHPEADSQHGLAVLLCVVQ